MAGSYNHVVTDHGNLVSNESFIQMIGNLGDAYETVEEMYGMIWYLAVTFANEDPAAAVEEARKSYEAGLKAAKAVKDKRGPDGG